MEFIQKKTADTAVESFLTRATESETSLIWDRYEGQLPECGFCEAGLSCRDCLQGPCISHPFKDSNKFGVCGKDKDILAIQSLLRLVLKGTMAYLDRVSDFTKGVESGEIKPKNKMKTDKILKEIKNLFENGGVEVRKELPKPLARLWDQIGISPEGMARDLFKASQRLEGGISDVEEILPWAFKSSLFGCMAYWLQGNLKNSVFGDPIPTKVEVNLGVLKKESPNLILYGYFSPILKYKIAEEAKKKGVHVTGVCSDPLIPPFSFSSVTNYGSQEIPLMTGAVDLMVVGDQFVNPSLSNLSRKWEAPIVPAEILKKEKDLGQFAREIVERAKKSFDFRRNITRDIPGVKENAIMGFSHEQVDIKKVLGALDKGQLTGIAILTGSNNVKYTQDQEILTLTQEFLKNDVLCISEGEASVTLAKYGFLNPVIRENRCGNVLSNLLSSLGRQIPSVLDFADGSVIDFLFNVAKAGKKELKDYPIVACFPEANRSSEVVEALGMVAMGISTYFWPALPITGSVKAMETLTEFCSEKFGSKLNIMTEKKIDSRTKANLVLKALRGEEGFGMSGEPWK
jgi:carbon-monoxide dehydrogenase catalytic subunit